MKKLVVKMSSLLMAGFVSVASVQAEEAAVASPKSAPVDFSAHGWRKAIPRPIHPNAELVDLYYKTWELAAKNVKEAPEGTPVRRYMDEACYPDQIWIWDTCFMAMFCKYAPDWYPGMETLDNLYVPIHDGVKSPLRIHLYDNPPLFAWIESMHYRFTGNKERLKHVVLEMSYLQRHYEFLQGVKRGVRHDSSPNAIRWQHIPDLGYMWDGGASGMDNTPRGRDAGGWNKIVWIDAISQQALSTQHIAHLLSQLGKEAEAHSWRQEYDRLKTLINKLYWDDEDGFYYDVEISTGKHCKVKTIASVWPLLAGVASPAQAKRVVEHIMNPQEFGGEFVALTLSRDDKDFNGDTGDYWRGGIWLPTAYMTVKALEQYGYKKEADAIAEKIVIQQLKTYQTYKPATIWEAYSPSANKPTTENGRIARPDFCGWSALGPISLFIENVLGFRAADATTNTLTWDIKRDMGRQGMENFRFGKITTDLVYDGKDGVKIRTNLPYYLIINGSKYRIDTPKTVITL